MSKTLLHHTLIKNILTFVLTSLPLYIFTICKSIVYYRLYRDGIYFDKILVSEYKLFKRSNKANLFIALVQYHISSENIILFRCSCIVQCSRFRNHRTRFFLFSTKPSVFSHQFSCESHKLLNCLEIDFLQIGIETDWLNSFINSRRFSFTVLFYKPY
jgi:hypothetical protein